jgi:hypothetical protein
MVQKLVLNTEGYQVTFVLKTIPDRTDMFDATISFLLDPRLGTVAFTAFPGRLTLETLQELVTYFEQHIAQIQINSSSESTTFFPLNFQFQLQALQGEIDAPDDGAFALRFMMDMQQPGVGATSVYIGGETDILMEDINSFLASVKQLIAETPHE